MRTLKDLIDNSMSENNWTQTEIAEKIGVSQPTINKIVNESSAVPSISTLKKFSAFFNVSLSELAGNGMSGSDLASIYAEGAPAVRKVPVLNKASCGKWKDFTDLSYPAGHADAFDTVGVSGSIPLVPTINKALRL